VLQQWLWCCLTADANPHLQVLVRVRPPIGHEANEELAVACSPSQEHVQVSRTVTNSQQCQHAQRGFMAAA